MGVDTGGCPLGGGGSGHGGRALDGGEGAAQASLELTEESLKAPRRDSAEPRPRGCSGLGEPRPALPSF